MCPKAHQKQSSNWKKQKNSTKNANILNILFHSSVKLITSMCVLINYYMLVVESWSLRYLSTVIQTTHTCSGIVYCTGMCDGKALYPSRGIIRECDGELLSTYNSLWREIRGSVCVAINRSMKTRTGHSSFNIRSKTL